MPLFIDANGRFKLPYRIFIALFHGLVAVLIAAKAAMAQPQPPAAHPLSPLVPGLIVTAIFGLLTMLKAVDGEGRIRNGWKVDGFIAAIIAVSIVLRGLVINGALGLHHLGMTGDEVVSVAITFLASWVCLKAEGNPFSSIGYRLSGRWAGDLGLGVLGGGAIMAITALAAMGAGGFHWTKGAGDLHALASGALLFILVGFFEETMFRGYLFQRLVAGLGEWPAQIVMALFFGLAHWGNPGMSGATLFWATVNIGLASVLLGLCYLRTKSLALPIGVHIGWNFTQGNILGFGVSGTMDAKGLLTPVFHGKADWITGGAFGLEASLPCVIVCGAAIVALLLWKGRASADPSTAQAS